MPSTTTTGVRQLSDGNGANGGPGTALGTGPTDKVGFFTSSSTAPVAQPSGAAQVALARGVAGACIATAATSASPGTVGVQTTSEKGITLGVAGATGTSATFQIAANDILYVNKPTAQAGLGVGNVRISATNIAAVTFSNFTAATITPTAAEKYGFVAIRGLPVLTATLTPASVAAASIVEQQFTVTGLRAGEVVQVVKPSSQATLDIVGCRVVSANVLGITYANCSATTAITPTAEQYQIFSTGGIDSAQNNIFVEQFGGTVGGVSNATTTSISMTMTGLALTDAVVGIMKPTPQAGVTPPGAFISGANALGVTFTNATAATVTPTANEIYGVTIFRPAPAAPCVNYAATLTPTSVAANTTAEQTFTPTGVSVVSGSVIWVNKPTWTNGLGIVGCRVSGTGSFCITFANNTAAAITPPSETYLIANFQQPIPDAGSTWVYTINAPGYLNTLLTNALRAALGPSSGGGLGAIAGA